MDLRAAGWWLQSGPDPTSCPGSDRIHRSQRNSVRRALTSTRIACIASALAVGATAATGWSDEARSATHATQTAWAATTTKHHTQQAARGSDATRQTHATRLTCRSLAADERHETSRAERHESRSYRRAEVRVARRCHRRPKPVRTPQPITSGGIGTNGAAIGPAGDAFYTPPAALPAGPHGTPIWERPYNGPAALKGAVNTLVLYTQIGISGKLVATSGAISVPLGKAPKGGWPVVDWAHGSTGIADQCAPTRYNNPKDAATNDPLLEAWIKDGYAVLRSNYEGLGTPGDHPYLIGPSEGRAVLDIVRAARQVNPDLANRVVIAGHSQGGHATLWAASLAPIYTPEMQLRGTLAFAPPSHTSQNFEAVRVMTQTNLTGTIALILRGADIADSSLHVESLLTAQAAALWPATLTQCLAMLNSPQYFGSIPSDQLVKPTADTSALDQELAANDPGNLIIPGPILIEQGLSDQTVPPYEDQALAAELTADGDHVTFHTYPGATHAGVIQAAATDATAFLREAFAGDPNASGTGPSGPVTPP